MFRPLATGTVCGFHDRSHSTSTRGGLRPGTALWGAGAKSVGSSGCDLSSGCRCGRMCACVRGLGFKCMAVPAFRGVRWSSSVVAAASEARADGRDGSSSPPSGNTKLGKLCRGEDFDEVCMLPVTRVLDFGLQVDGTWT